MTVEKFISVKLEGKSIAQVTNDILDSITGSVELTGSGGIFNSQYRDYDIQASNEQELDTFLDLLSSKGYNIA